MNGDPFGFELPCQEDFDEWLEDLAFANQAYEDLLDKQEDFLEAEGEADFQCNGIDIDALNLQQVDPNSQEGRCVDAMSMLELERDILEHTENLSHDSDAARDQSFKFLQDCLTHAFDSLFEED